MAAKKFNVVVDAPLTSAQTKAVDKAIQAAVLQQVAKIDNGIFGRKIDLGGRTGGIACKAFKTLEALKKNGAFRKI